MRALAEYASALIACAAAAVLLLGLSRADLSVPWWYDGDALYYGAVVQAICDHGWYLTNPSLGMPLGQELHDFPMPDTLSFLLLRALSGFGDGAVCLNLFYLTSFPLTTLTALWVLRRLGVSYWPALLATLLYTFTPHRLVYGEYHLMYTTYWAVPPMMLVLLRIGTGELALERWRDLRARGVLGSGAACVAIASTGGVYYPFFACVLLGGTAIYAAVRARAARRMLLPLALALFTFAVFVVNLLPCILHRLAHGATTTAQRGAQEAEVFALKIAQVLLPVGGHRVSALADLRRAYDAHDPLVLQQPVALGVLGSAGLLALLGWLLYRRQAERDGRTARLLDGLSVLSVTGLLLGTVGGFGALFAFLVSPQLRGYAAIIVYLALFSCTAVALLLDRLRPDPARGRARQVAFAVATLALLALALLDQTPARALPDFAATQQAYAADRRTFAQVEAAVPPGAMVFQLPRQEFPEGESYEPLKAYLHTRTVRWSFGAMRGRPADLWQRHVVALAPVEMVDVLTAAGFAGIVFDRVLGGDAGRALEAAVVAHAGPPTVASADGRYAFVPLAALAAQLQARPDAALQRERALHPVLVTWGPQFTAATPGNAQDWRGCRAQGEIALDNWLPRSRRVRLAMTLVAPAPSTLAVASNVITERVPVTRQPTEWTRDLELPPGVARLQLTCDGAEAQTLPWLPPMAFGIRELSVRDLDGAPAGR